MRRGGGWEGVMMATAGANQHVASVGEGGARGGGLDYMLFFSCF